MATMLEDLKSVMEANKNLLPLISMYWEYTVVDENKNKIKKEDLITVVSLNHNTSKYKVHTLYKPISTTIDLNYYE